MSINEKVDSNIFRAKQAMDNQEAYIESKGGIIMPETMDIIFDLFHDKCNIEKENILEAWLKVLGSPKGVSSELGELQEFFDLQDDLAELNRLDNELKNKDQKRREAWEEYAINLNGVNTDIELPDPLQSSITRRQVI